MSVRTLIVDDEAAARARLCKLLTVFPQLQVIEEARDGVEAVQLIAKLQPDLVFLDVQMPGLDGFEVLRSLPPDAKWPLVIFATAFDRYALQAFEAEAAGYLLKPVNREKLARAVERASQLLAAPRDASRETSRLRDIARSAPAKLSQVVARFRDRFILLPLEEAFFFRMEDGLIKVKSAGQLYRTDYTLSDLEKRLPNPPFFRAHRSAIVNLNLVAEVDWGGAAYTLVMKDQHKSEITVSERQSPRLREFLRKS